MKRLTICIFIVTTILIALTACHVKNEADPLINITFSAAELSDEDYDSVGTAGQENPKKEDFKKIEFSLEVKQSDEITDRSIIVPDIKNLVNSKEPQRYWFGSSSQQDNPQENVAHYDYSFVLYTKGLDEQGIRDIFKPQEVRISYADKNDVYKEKVIKLWDILQFEK
jgi:hypothetical protein